MINLLKIYQRNVYGVIGTLVFHVLLVGSFLLAEVDMKGNIREEPLVIEFPDILPEEEEVKVPVEDSPEELSPPADKTVNNLTNAASNRLSDRSNTNTPDKFFDDQYLKEINEAKQLVSNVNNQLSKEKLNIGNIKMPVETTEGMNPDSIKNTIYAGESNIVYYLENRYHVSLPIPVYLAKGGGKIIVDIVVDRNGRVTQAAPRTDRSIQDEQIMFYARAAALKTLFNADPSAPAAQRGTIHYTFVAQ
ncbi:MAG: hypothetical protein FD181_3017 [Prolixibacteraceae bacterium]|nr:MAG: hypothetical protein FD181_3017 [Prolixibacteraceae bacterium]